MSIKLDRRAVCTETLVKSTARRIGFHTRYSVEQDMRAGLRTCVTCCYFNQEPETCRISDDRRPPAKVIAYGCEKYSDLFEDIPF